MTAPVKVRYYSSTRFEPTALLRRTEGPDGPTDEAFVNGAWRPSKSISDYMVGNDDHVDDLTEAQARKLAPAAFS